MCGIVGFVTSQPRSIFESVLDPLQQLEYRGYDSCGVAYDDGKVTVTKTVGDVSQLRGRLNEALPSRAIAHTRWATHGPVNERNTHPHVSGRIFVVHNGVIDNYEELKQKLISQGCRFTSDTDTEVIAHLVRVYAEMGHPLATSVTAALRDLRGKFSFVVLDSANDGIVAAKQGRPLSIYKNSTATYVASDVAAFSGMEPGEITFISDGEVVEIRQGGYVRFTRDDVPFPRKLDLYQPMSLSCSTQLRSIMEAEIAQQPIAVRDTLETVDLTEKLQALALEEKFKIKIIGCGTSYHAGLIGARWIKALSGAEVSVEISSEFASMGETDQGTDLYVFISQSGETADTLAALDRVEMFIQARTLAICNVDHSELVRRTMMYLPTRAGIERSVASTKAFTAQLTALLKLGIMLGNVLSQGLGSNAFIAVDLVQELKLLPNLIEETIRSFYRAQLGELDPPKVSFFLGRGVYLPIAMEGALKLNEIAYVPSLAYTVGELKHGPLALIQEGTPVFVCFNGREPHLEKLFSAISQVEARRGSLHLITDEKGAQEAKKHGISAKLYQVPTVSRYEYYLSPLLAAIMLQLIAHEIALKLGRNVDKPRNLAKSVTVE